jgi:hypothetical protein
MRGDSTATAAGLFGSDFPFGHEIGVRYTPRGIAQYPGFSDRDRMAVLDGNIDQLLSTMHQQSAERTIET